MDDTIPNPSAPVDVMPPADAAAQPPIDAPALPEIGAADINPDELAHEMTLSENDAKLEEVDEAIDKYKMHRNPDSKFKYFFDDILMPWYKNTLDESESFVFASYRNWLVSENFTSLNSDNKWAEYMLGDDRGWEVINRVRTVIEGKPPLPKPDNTPAELPVPESENEPIPEISAEDVATELDGKSELDPADLDGSLGESEISADDISGELGEDGSGKESEKPKVDKSSKKKDDGEEIAADELSDELKKSGLDVSAEELKEAGK